MAMYKARRSKGRSRWDVGARFIDIGQLPHSYRRQVGAVAPGLWLSPSSFAGPAFRSRKGKSRDSRKRAPSQNPQAPFNTACLVDQARARIRFSVYLRASTAPALSSAASNYGA